MSLLFNLLDIISGCLKALKNHNLCSKKLKNGLFNKCGFILTYIISFLIVQIPEVKEIISFNLQNYICFYVIYTELISILENLYELNPQIKLDFILKYFRVKEEE